MRRSRYVVLTMILGGAPCGCRSSALLRAGDQDSAAADASHDAREDGPALAIEAGPADDALPPTSSDELASRARHLLEAIAKDDPTLATDILFPRDGWLGTRDVGDPGRDWESRLASPFRRALHALSRRHKKLERAQFASLELGHGIMQATPRRHGWKKPMWTVGRAHLTFVVDGRTASLPIRELTAWRGAWYVTRLR